MDRATLGMAVFVIALGSAQAVWADYEAGQRAWDAGRPHEARAQWREAAEAGDPRAMLALGRLYMQGLGVIQDYVEAHKWLNLAASRGETDALLERDALAAKMTPRQIAAAQERASSWRFAAGDEADTTGSGAARDPVAPRSASPPPSPPPQPAAVREAQALLAALGYDVGPIDGKWGKRSGGAYRAFAGDAGLPVFGTLTPDGLAAMRWIADRRGVTPSPTPSATESRRTATGSAVARRELPNQGEVFRDCTDCPEMVVVPEGSYLMGSPADEPERWDDEGPRHPVTIARRFAVGRFEVTFAQWDACRRAGGCSRSPGDEGWGRANRPVINVSWKDAREYVGWLSEKTGVQYRLLTEAEWEYAARAGTHTRYHWGDGPGHGRANCGRCGGRWGGTKTAPPGSFPPNGFGLFDMLGNVWEWVEDCGHPSYSGAPSDGSAWLQPGDCRLRMLRGGSWEDAAGRVRSAIRYWEFAETRSNVIGFRVARTLH